MSKLVIEAPASMRPSSETRLVVNGTKFVQKFRDLLENDPMIAKSVATVKLLVDIISDSSATTVYELLDELNRAIRQIISGEEELGHPTLNIKSGGELLLRFIGRKEKETRDFEEVRALVVETGNGFVDQAQDARLRVARLAVPFIRDGMVILNHGHSRAALKIYKRAASQRIRFTVITTEGPPLGGNTRREGIVMAQELAAIGIPVRLIIDSAVGFFMEQVDMVMVGAEAIVESGGIINRVGTFEIAAVAKLMNKPFYVAAESYKFCRVFPTSQRDIPAPDVSGPEDIFAGRLDLEGSSSSLITTTNPRLDLTPPSFITLLFTDLGVLTPSAVSDELIQLFL